MRKLLRELFYVPKYAKVKERTLYARLASSVVIIVLCMAAMGFSAFAYFNASVTSGTNTIKAASFDVEVVIKLSDAGVEPQADGSYQLAAGTYQVTVKRTQDSTASTGYCKVQMGTKTFITCQLGKDVTAENGTRTEHIFKLNVPNGETVRVDIEACWGTSTYYAMGETGVDANDLYIHDGETITISVDKAQIEGLDKNEVKPPMDQMVSKPMDSVVSPRGEIAITVKKTDTLYSLARTYDVTIEAIMEYNGLTDRSIIITGSILLIPPEEWQTSAEQNAE